MSDASPRRIDAPRRLTIGVSSNRQLYVGATISRYEQTLLRGVRAAPHGCNLLLACGSQQSAAPGAPSPAERAGEGWALALGEPATTWYEIGVRREA